MALRLREIGQNILDILSNLFPWRKIFLQISTGLPCVSVNTDLSPYDITGSQSVLYPKVKLISLTHWGRVTHICVGNLTIIGSDKGLSPGRRQAITGTNVGILLIGPLGTSFSEMLIEIHTLSFKKIHLKMSSGKWWPFCLGLNELTQICETVVTVCLGCHKVP